MLWPCMYIMVDASKSRCYMYIKHFVWNKVIYRIYLIKRPGVYFILKSVEGAFNRGGLLIIVMSTSNSCTAAVIMLFLRLCHSSQHKSVVFLPLCRYLAIINSIYYSTSLASIPGRSSSKRGPAWYRLFAHAPHNPQKLGTPDIIV